MRIRIPLILIGCISLLAASLAAAASEGDASAAQQSFDDANIAFRNANYSGALAAYNDAMVNGKKSPRLFYNMGLTHYRLGQHVQAKWAFAESAKDGGLAALSYYQLGVISEKENDSVAAARWFERSRDNAQSSRLRQLSRDALETIGVSQPKLTAVLSAGFGYDSNAFRTPSVPYVDLSQPVPTPVVPVQQSGTYIPVRIRAEYINPLASGSQLVASYRHRGFYYADAALDNAEETDHRLTVGIERKLGSRNSRDRQLSYSAFFRSHGESNFDRDDGLDRFDTGASTVDRYNFRGFGAKAELRNRIGRYRYEVSGGISQRDYDEVPNTPSYDMTIYRLGGALKIPLSDSSRFKLGYDFRVRDFDQRHARDSNGNSSTQNSTLEYQYHQLQAGVRKRFSEAFVTEIIYLYTLRNDQFVGYNDYTKSKIRLETTFDLSSRFAASIDIDYRNQDYSNAYAFDDPTQLRKEYQEFQVSAKAVYRLSEQLTLRADIKQEAIESSDPRGEYDRTRASIGVSWEF